MNPNSKKALAEVDYAEVDCHDQFPNRRYYKHFSLLEAHVCLADRQGAILFLYRTWPRSDLSNR
jgi:hypothetical protein